VQTMLSETTRVLLPHRRSPSVAPFLARHATVEPRVRG
jgi:hypothetical protein